MKEKKIDAEKVSDFIEKLEHPLKPEVEFLRKLIRKTDKRIQERIKWNAPSYYIEEDLFTFGPFRNETLLIVFHHPEIVNVKSELLEGEYKDRRLLYLNNKKHVKSSAGEITKIIAELIRLSDKKKTRK
jgi:hypothetical protein